MARASLTPLRHRLRIVLTTIPLIAIFFFGVSILHRRAWRLDLTPELRHTLSDRARRVVGELPPGTTVRAFLRSQDARNMMLRDLLRQIETAAPGVRTEVVDVNRTPALALEYGVRGVAFVVETPTRRRVVSNPNEESLVAGVLDVLRTERARIGWIVGHGEGDLESGERRTGYAQLRHALELEHRDVRPISLGDSGLDETIDVAVIVAPRGDYLPDELGVLDRHLRRGGALLVLLDAGRAPRLASFLGRYGIRLPDDVVLDPRSRLYGGEDLTIRLTLDQRSHPIVRSLAAPPLFSRARSVGVDTSVGDVRGLEFLFAADSSFATPRRHVAMTALPSRFDSERDRAGPISVGVEVVSGPSSQRARIVVFGSGEFASNFFLDFLGNKDLVLNAVGWLAQAEGAMGHRPERQRPGVNQFFVSEEQGRRTYWIAAVLQPMVLAAIGVALVARRRWW